MALKIDSICLKIVILRIGQWKLNEDFAGGTLEHHDLEIDLGEANNLFNEINIYLIM